jgi:hypothetical protein
MAQTIAVRSGTATHTFNGTSNNYTTLFTQSTGTATRVILNQLMFLSSTTDGVYMPYSVGVWHYSPATGQRTPAFTYKNTGQSCSSFSFFPGSTHQGGVGGNTANSIWNSGQVLTGYLYNTTISEANPSIVSAHAPYYSDNYVLNPGSIYIANGDSLQIHGYWQNQPGTCYYSFTTITES